MDQTAHPLLWIIWLGLACLVIAIAVAGLILFGAVRWAGATRKLMRQLEATRVPGTRSSYDAHETVDLPKCVARYFHAVLRDGQCLVSAATVRHTGTFNLKMPGEQWKPFTSEQRVLTHGPGFVWNGRIAMAPGIAVHVHDAYIGGHGLLLPALLGLFPLANPVDAKVLAHGELVRYFAEAALYPTALLPSQGVCWEAVNDHSARATLVDGAQKVEMLVTFNAADLIESVRVEARGATLGNKVVMTPWEGRWSNYRECGGMLVPFTGEAAWLGPAGRHPYWRGTIATLDFEFCPPRQAS